jgi:hypothetical protein
MIGGAGLTVAQGATLTVPAGTVVKTTSRGELNVDGGSLIANGTSGSPIVFTSSSHDSSVGGATDTSQDQPHVRRLGRVVGRRVWAACRPPGRPSGMPHVADWA